MTTKRDIQHTTRHQALKREARALISAAGGVKEAAELTRVNASALSDYQSMNTDAFMPVDVVADLEAVTYDKAGHPIMTRRLSIMAGGAYVEVPEADAMDKGWVEQIGVLVADNGVIASRLCDALADDQQVDAGEVRKLGLIAACDDAILHLVNLRARFERIVEEGR